LEVSFPSDVEYPTTNSFLLSSYKFSQDMRIVLQSLSTSLIQSNKRRSSEGSPGESRIIVEESQTLQCMNMLLEFNKTEST